MTYNIGDRVALTKTTESLPGVPLGGLGTVGEVRDLDSVFPLRVRWDDAPDIGWYPGKGALIYGDVVRPAEDRDAPTVHEGDRVRYTGTSFHARGVVGVVQKVEMNGGWLRIKPDGDTTDRTVGVFTYNVTVVERADTDTSADLADWEIALLEADKPTVDPLTPTTDPALRERMLVLALKEGMANPREVAAAWATFITTGAIS